MDLILLFIRDKKGFPFISSLSISCFYSKPLQVVCLKNILPNRSILLERMAMVFIV